MTNQENIINHIKTYYSKALLHLVWITLRNSDGTISRRLVFGLLEFYPSEISPIPFLEQEGRFKGFRIYYQRVVIEDMESAVKLYRSIQEKSNFPKFWDVNGNINQEVLKGNGIKGNGTAERILCNNLQDYKIWPNFILSSKKSEKREDDNPFIADIWNIVRTHQLMPDEADPIVLDAVNHENVGKWLEQYMNWNISYYPELAGSVIMVLPNPYYSNMRIRVMPVQAVQNARSQPKMANKHVEKDAADTEVKSEQIRIEFTPRHDRDLSELTVIPFENTYFGVTGGTEYKIVDNMVSIPAIGIQAEQFGCYVVDCDGNLTDFRDFSNFWRKFQMNIYTGGVTKKVSNLNSDGYRNIQTYDKADTVVSGEDEQPLGKRLTDAVIYRRRKRRVEQTGVRFFYRDHEGAEKYIRSLLSNARDRVVIVDPYAATNELFAYAMNISMNDAKITIITSKVYLRKKSKLSVYTERGEAVPTLGEELQAQVDNYKKRTGIGVKTLVMTGDNPAIHDRFLIVDDTAWFCGGSLNELGNRMSCVVKLPDSEELGDIIADIENSDQVKTLEKWIEERSQLS